MDQARTVLKVGLVLLVLLVLVLMAFQYVYDAVGLYGIIDLVWKVLVLLLLADISLKLGTRNQSK